MAGIESVCGIQLLRSLVAALPAVYPLKCEKKAVGITFYMSGRGSISSEDI